MKTLKIDENNDIVFSGGHLKLCDGIEAQANICRHFALANRGEMALKGNLGIPFFNVAFGAYPNPSQFEAAFRSRMKEIKGVKGVTFFEASVNGETLNYTATIETEEGEIKINESL